MLTFPYSGLLQQVCSLLFPLLRPGARVVNVSSSAGFPGHLLTSFPGMAEGGTREQAQQVG